MRLKELMTKKIWFDNIDVSFKGQIAEKKRISKFCRSTIHYFMPRLRREVEIQISFTKSIPDALGYCLGDKNFIDIEISKTNPMTGKPQSMSQMMMTLAHELVHAKQFSRGDLTPSLVNYKGKKDKFTPYSRQPWEREAYKKEEMIYDLFWSK